MSKIKVGDIVELKVGDEYRGKLHNEVTSISDDGSYLRVNGNLTGNPRSWFKVVDANKYHKHHDLSIAWAKGAEIECQFLTFTFYGQDKNPSWFTDYKYHIKPNDPTELEKLKAEHRAMGKTIDKLTKGLAND